MTTCRLCHLEANVIVSELIEKLRHMPQDAEVYFPERGGNLIKAEEIERREDDVVVMP